MVRSASWRVSNHESRGVAAILRDAASRLLRMRSVGGPSALQLLMVRSAKRVANHESRGAATFSMQRRVPSQDEVPNLILHRLHLYLALRQKNCTLGTAGAVSEVASQCLPSAC